MNALFQPWMRTSGCAMYSLSKKSVLHSSRKAVEEGACSCVWAFPDVDQWVHHCQASLHCTGLGGVLRRFRSCHEIRGGHEIMPKNPRGEAAGRRWGECVQMSAGALVHEARVRGSAAYVLHGGVVAEGYTSKKNVSKWASEELRSSGRLLRAEAACQRPSFCVAARLHVVFTARLTFLGARPLVAGAQSDGWGTAC
eukprot:1139967-Pelagomonas_calceolata.AAC.7